MAIFSRWVKSPTEAVSAGSKVIHTHFSSLSRFSKEQLEVTAQVWQQYSMQNLMVGERGFKEEIKAPIFLEAVLAIETIQMSLFNLEEKWNLNFLNDDFLSKTPHFLRQQHHNYWNVKRNKSTFSSIIDLLTRSHILHQSTVFRRSEANSSCCYKLEASWN